MEKTTAPKRKTGRMIAKNLIILLVVAIVAALAIWAWFSKHTSATADGINVQAQGGGVEVSWTGADGTYYENLTALNDSETDDTTGLAKEIDDEYSTLNLITGNGNLFFIPTLNRRTGAVVTNTDGTWCGSSFTKTADESIMGKYIDIPLYFRSTASKNVYLSSDSIVAPLDTEARMSSYGNFSTDYICSAARVAFIEGIGSGTTSVKYIWAPNSNYELVENDDGYQLVDDTVETEEIVDDGSGDISWADNFGGLVTEDNTTYYFWVPTTYDSDYAQQYSDMVSDAMTFKQYSTNESGESIGLYVFDYTLTKTTSMSNTTSTIMFGINESSTTKPNYNNGYIDASQSYEHAFTDSDPLVKVTNTAYTTANDTQSNAFYISGWSSNSENYITITFGYNPDTNRVLVLGYEDTNGEDSTDFTEGTASVTTINYYEIDDAYVALGNISTKTAVTTDSTYSSKLKNVTFTDSTTISNNSITTYEQFRIVKEGTGYEATYTLQNTKDSSYVVLNGTTVTFSSDASAATAFSLRAYDGVTGPVLVSGDYCLGVVDAKLTGITTASLTASPSRAVTIFKGAGYKMLLTSSSSQTYQFYNWDTKKLETLDENSYPPLYATEAYETGKTVSKVGGDTDGLLVRLKKDSDSDYYTGQITMRIWVEGTDRDALAPLAGGKFKLNLHFTS